MGGTIIILWQTIDEDKCGQSAKLYIQRAWRWESKYIFLSMAPNKITVFRNSCERDLGTKDFSADRMIQWHPPILASPCRPHLT